MVIFLFDTHPPARLLRPASPPSCLELSLFLSSGCRLFCAHKTVNSFPFNHFPPLFQKHPGWGCSKFLQPNVFKYMSLCNIRLSSRNSGPSARFSFSVRIPLSSTPFFSASAFLHPGRPCRDTRSACGDSSPFQLSTLNLRSRLSPLFATLTHSAPVTPLFATLSSKIGGGREGRLLVRTGSIPDRTDREHS